jgi:hypothetical protein
MLTTIAADDLAKLSLFTARELDRKLGGESLDISILRQLGQQLSRASGMGEPSARSLLQSDPLTTEVLAQAVSRISSHPPSDLESLSGAIRSFVANLNNDASELDLDQLRSLKQFCLSLHRSIAAQQVPSIYDGESVFDAELRFA